MNKNIRGQQDMGTGSVPALLAKLAVPAVVAQLISLLYNIVDRIYIGHIPEIGASALTGVGLCMPVLILINAFAALAGSGGAPRAAIAMGKEDYRGAEKILANCFTILLILAVLLTVFFYASAPMLLQMFGASDVTLPYALSYIRIYVLGTVSVMFVMGMNMFITTQGFSTFSMLTTVIGAVINIILDPILIFTFHMGVQGAAVATVISQCVSAVWVLLFLTGKKTLLHLKVSDMPLKKDIILPCLALGLSSFVMFSTESLLTVSFNSNLARYGGDIAVGAMTILTSVYQLIMLPIQGVCQGGQPIMSFNFGAENRERVKQTFRLMFGICLGYTVLFTALVMVAPAFFAKIFNDNEVLIEYTVWAMRIYMIGAFVMGCQVSCQQGFMALGQAKTSLLLACLRKVILLIPLIYILPWIIPNQVFAVFLAEPIADVVASAVTGYMFFSRFNRILDKGSGNEKKI